MRATFLAIALSFASTALAAEAAPATPATAAAAVPSNLPAEASDCLECHKQGGDGPAVSHLAEFGKSVHGQQGVGCKDCHQGYAMGPHDGEVKLSPADAATKLGMTVGAVRVAKCRVLARLRTAVTELEKAT